ncbi:GH1 family beta-glucosidase [Shewanella sp. ENK2]|uniref:GH1 family beta-glucosidase n=1 Tax=Shewanella sp. ENK2 TaxID=2775245 RepID=UPI0037492B30
MKLQFNNNAIVLSDEFTLGVATAAQQIEGGRSLDGRIDSIWDAYAARKDTIENGDTPTNACEHYRLLDQDIAMIIDLGVDAYRFSIAWPRVMDEQGEVNPLGLAFYERIVDALLANGITPYITLYHWDLPECIQKSGGWENRDTTDLFAQYVDVISQHFKGRVQHFSTLNEPWCSAFLGNLYGIHAPGNTDRKTAYIVGHHLLLAHGKACRVIRKNISNAQIGIVLNGGPTQGFTDSIEDNLKAELAYHEMVSFFAEPIYKAQYPSLLRKLFPDFFDMVLAEDLDIISAELDYLGVNYYTRNFVTDAQDDIGYQTKVSPGAVVTAMGWEVYPQGLTEFCMQLNESYQPKAIYILENGAAFDDQVVAGEVNDDARCEYIYQHLLEVEKMFNFGVPIKGYFVWSLMDNFEWAFGYNKRFGIVHVDYQTQQRTLKRSAHAIKALLKQKKRINSAK